MKRPWIAIFSVGFLALCNCGDATSQRIPEQNSHKSASQVQPTLQPIATGKQRISRDSQTIAIFRGNQNITVDYFTELVIGTMIAEKAVPEKRIAGLFSLGVPPTANSLIMAENVFRVEKVLTSTAQNPVKIQMNDRVYRLQPGEILFLLG